MARFPLLRFTGQRQQGLYDVILEKFGKPFGLLKSFKVDLFDYNDQELKRAKEQAEVYLQQPPRVTCKMCDGSLPSWAEFVKHGIPYAICAACGHLNGLHEDTESYATHVYLLQDYGRAYAATDAMAYRNRVEAIYLPKVDFLVECLSHHGISPAKLQYCDLGAGSGHFLAALALRGLSAEAWETAESQVHHGLAMLEVLGLPLHIKLLPDGLEGIYGLARTTVQQVVSLIGVLEHLPEPHRLLSALAGNPCVKYLYLSVPLHSLSVLLEAASPDIAPRQLTGGHTHPFSLRSLEYIEKRYCLNRLGAWWFGSDCLDLYRELKVRLGSDTNTKTLASSLDEFFDGLLDEWQAVLDRRRLCSEVHLLYRIGQ